MTTYYRPPQVNATKILTRSEMARVLSDLKRQFSAATCTSTRRMRLLELTLFRLAVCCGLRVSEIAELKLSDVRCEGSKPHLRIRRGAAKGGRSRMVPLWWDRGTLEDITQWKSHRYENAAVDEDYLLTSGRAGRESKRFSRHTLRRRFLFGCQSLGETRCRQLTIHHGRHTFISHALAGGRTLAEVRDAAGHANVSITSAYLHIAVEEEGVGELFAVG